MAKKKKKQKQRAPRQAQPRPTSPSGKRPAKDADRPAAGGKDRRVQKEQVRHARERARKAAARRGVFRRALIGGAIGLSVILAFSFLTRAGGATPIPAEAVAAAKAAGCSTVQTPAAEAPAQQHLDSGQPTTYPDPLPGTSGFHDPSSLPDSPHVYKSVVPETQAVHNLEHAFVLIYYRQSGDGALPQDVVTQLETVANASKRVIMAPYENLPEGQALALAAWNKLQTCGNTVTSDQAKTIAQGFITAYACTSNAPETPGC